MDTIFKGKLPGEKTYRGVCGQCKSQVKAKHKELNHSSGRYNEVCHFGPCPVCHGTMSFELERKVQ